MLKTTPVCSLLLTFALGLAGVPAPAAAAPLGPEAFKPTVKPPGFAAVQKLSRIKKLGVGRAHSPGAPLGGTRFASVVSYTRGPRSAKGPAVHLLIIDRQGDGWRLVQRLPFTLWLDTKGRRDELCDERKLAAKVMTGDYDKDGKREALVRYMFCWMIPGIGPTSVRRMALVNLDGKPREAVNIQLDHLALPTTAGDTKGRYRFKDLNKDGHPDLLVRYKGEFPDEEAKGGARIVRSEVRFLYDPGKDLYKKAKPKPRKRRGKR
jgi:hypothetical protein